MTSLSLGYTLISDISALANLEKLEWLDLRYNKITDLTPVLEIKNLRGLLLFKSDLSDGDEEFLREKLGDKVLDVSELP